MLPSRPLRSDGWLVVIPGFLWWVLVHLRSRLMEPRCASDPASCGMSGIFWPDQWAVLWNNRTADHWSFVTQYAAGAAAVLIPLWYLKKHHHRFSTAQTEPFWKRYRIEFVILLQSVLWNGTVNEFARLTVQRPRPFVYANPESQGLNPAHYTSFYSGHTSFTAVASMSLLFILASLGASRKVLILTSVWSGSIVFATGLLRVLSGRHFPTDVFIAALAGSVMAWIIARIHRNAIS